MTNYKNCITGHGVEPLDGILFNPMNWRIHPGAQQQALEGVLDTVGWVQDVIVNQRTGHLVDGHLRCQVAARNGDKTIPVVYVDLSEEEEALVLATIDPIAAMAATDRSKLDDLLQSVQSDDERVQALIDGLGIREGIIPPVDYDAEWQGMPEFQQEDLSAWKSIIVHFDNFDNMAAFSQLVGQVITEKTKSIYYPKKERENLLCMVCHDES